MTDDKEWLARYRRKIRWRRLNEPVTYRMCDETFDCHPLVLELIGKMPGDRISLLEDCRRLSASMYANILMRQWMHDAQAKALQHPNAARRTARMGREP